jgi:hypothetical protein
MGALATRLRTIEPEHPRFHRGDGYTDLPDEEGTETVLAEAARSFLGRERLRRTLCGHDAR